MGLDKVRKTPCGFCFVEYPLVINSASELRAQQDQFSHNIVLNTVISVHNNTYNNNFISRG